MRSVSSLARSQSVATVALCILGLAGCGGGGDGGGTPPPPQNPPASTHRIGGTVAGLGGTGLILQLNGGQDLPVATDGTFTFPIALTNDSSYSITVLSQPSAPTQACVVAAGQGRLQGRDVSDARVACTTNAYPLRVMVSGLAGAGLTIVNGAQTVVVPADGEYSFADVLSGAAFNVSVGAQPRSPSQTCLVDSGAGTVTAQAVSVRVRCATNAYRVRGAVTGLAGTGLAVRLGNETLQPSANGSFAFSSSLASGSAYAIALTSQPLAPTQTCVVTGATGVIGDGDAQFSVHCETNRYRLRAVVSGVRGTGLRLRAGSEDLIANADGTFLFATSFASGTTYHVTIESQPGSPAQTCAVADAASGAVTSNDIEVAVACITNRYSVRGTVTGLSGSGLVLNLSAESITIDGNGTFVFPTPVPSGEAYSVTLASQPTEPTQTCTLTDNAGTVADSDVHATVECVTNRYSVRGRVTGLSGSGLVLKSGAEPIVIDGDGAFEFPTLVASGEAYSVTVASQPAGPTQTCTVADDEGTVADSDVQVTVECVTRRFVVRGTVSGLLGSGLSLRLNNLQDATPGADGRFAFTQDIASGEAFALTIATQPTSPAQTCVSDHDFGTVTDADVQLTLTCTTHPYSIGGTVTGLVGSGLVLRSQPGGDAAITHDGSFEFPTAVLPGRDYEISVAFRATAPVQSCEIVNGTGTVGEANVTNVSVQCSVDRLLYASDRDAGLIRGFTVNSVTGTLFPLGNAPIAAGAGVGDLILHPMGSYLYAVNAGANSISAFAVDAVSGQLTAVTGSPFATGAQPVRLAIDAAGRFLYVTNYTDDTVSGYAINAATGALVPLAGSPFGVADKPSPVVVSPSGNTLYIASQDDHRVHQYAIAPDGALAATGNSGFAPAIPFDLAFDHQGARLYSVGVHVALYVSDIDPMTGTLSTNQYTAQAGGERIAIHPDAPFALVSNQGSLSVYALDASTGEPEAIPDSPFPSGREPNEIAFHPERDFVYVTDLAHGGIRGYVIDRMTGALTPISGSPFFTGPNYAGVVIR